MRQPPRIVAAVDFSPAGHRICQAAAEYARVHQSEIVLVHVVHELSALLGTYPELSTRELQDVLEREGGAKLRALAREHFAAAKIPHRVVLLVGTPWAEILDCTAHEAAALLVIGTHSSSKPEHAIAGSTVRRVIENARCRVLLVPPE